jgi:uncharacterized protein
MKVPAETVLITGASSGIGLDLARLFAKNKYRLILTSSNDENIKSIAHEIKNEFGIEAIGIGADLSQQGASDELFAKVMAEGNKIDILINNAGLGKAGLFGDHKTREIVEMLNVNMVNLTLLTHLALHEMKLNGKGKILNVASTAGFQAGPYMAVYYATKAYVLHFSEALTEEYKHYNIQVTAFCPGPVDTNFINRAGLNNSKLFRYLPVMSSETAAHHAYKAVIQKSSLKIPGVINRILAFATRLTPRSLTVKISGYLNRILK